MEDRLKEIENNKVNLMNSPNNLKIKINKELFKEKGILFCSILIFKKKLGRY